MLQLFEAVLPYTDANLNLVFNPHRFFNDLQSSSKYSRKSYQNSFYKLKKQGYIEFNGNTPRLTRKGINELSLYKPIEVSGACIMVIFDIPEEYRDKRNKLRLLLKELRFKQEQKSVWVTKYECREYLKAEIQDLNIELYVKVFESSPIKL